MCGLPSLQYSEVKLNIAPPFGHLKIKKKYITWCHQMRVSAWKNALKFSGSTSTRWGSILRRPTRLGTESNPIPSIPLPSSAFRLTVLPLLFPYQLSSSMYGTFIRSFTCCTNRPHYGSCPSVRPSVCLSVPYGLLTRKQKKTHMYKAN